MNKKNFIKRIFLVFFPGNGIRIFHKDNILKAKIKSFKGKEITLISPKFEDMKLGDEVMLESLFEGAYYQADFQISDIRDFSETENLIILNLKSNFRIKTKRSMERHYVSIPILIEDKYNGVIWDFNEMFLGIVTLNEYIYEIQKNVSVKLSIPDFNITFHGTIIKIRQEFFNLSKFIFEIKIMQDPTGLFGQYLNQIIGENVFHNKEIEEEENSGGAEQ